MILKQAPLFPSFRSKVLAGLTVVAILIIGIWQRNLWLVHVLTEPVQITPAGHFYQGQQEFALRSPVQGTIRYTTDGSLPTATASAYTQPFPLQESALVQYAVFQGKRQLSPTQVHDVIIDGNHTVPVLAINTDPKNLWDPKIGIYTAGEDKNFTREGKEWERPALLRLYETDQKLGFEQTIGIRIHGLAMRGMPQKSLRIYVQDSEGHQTTLNYPLFGPGSNQPYATFVLRSGGDSQFSLMRDRLAHTLTAQSTTEVDSLRSRPVVLYLNGQYWGLYYLQERFDEQYFAHKYRVDPEALAMVEVALSGHDTRGRAAPDRGKKENAEAYNKMLDFVGRCRWCVSVGEIANQADTANLLDYLLLEFYFANFDWPYNNVKAWRYETDTPLSPETAIMPELDGRFRWLLFDVDVGFGPGRATLESMADAASGNPYSGFTDPAFPFANLFYDSVFQRRYEKRMRELLGTTLSATAAAQTIDQLAADIRPEMPRHIARWGHLESDRGLHVVASMEEWEWQVELLKEFVRQRPEHFTQRTQDFFEAAREAAFAQP